MKNNDWEKEFDEKFQTNSNLDIDKIKKSPWLLKDFIRTQKQLSKIEGRLIELDILEAHLNKQIYDPTVSTSSIYVYIKKAREAINSEIKSQDEENKK